MTTPVTYTPTLTTAGQAAAFNASSTGLQVAITNISFGGGTYNPTGAETALTNQYAIVPIAGGGPVSASQIRISSVWSDNTLTVPITEIGLWAGSVLFAVWSTSAGTPLAYKTPGTDFVLFSDITFGQIPANSITVTVNPDSSAALAALSAHEIAANAHPQYQLISTVAQSVAPLSWCGTAGGTANAVLLTLPSASVLTSYVAGQAFRFQAGASNTGPVTVNVAGLGVKSITKSGTSPLSSNDIVAGGIYELVYDGTEFQITGGVGGGQTFTPYAFTATAGQTVFTFNYTPGALITTKDGRTLSAADIASANSGTSVTLAAACAAGDQIEFFAFGTFTVANTYSKSDTDALLNRYIADTGTVNAYVGTYSPVITALADGMVLRFKASNANTGASTFTPNGLASAPILTSANTVLVGTEIKVSSYCSVTYSAALSSWILTSATAVPGFPGIPYSTLAGAYPLGATIPASNYSGFWVNTVAANTASPEVTNGSLTGWFPSNNFGLTAVTGLAATNVTLTSLQAAKDSISLAGTLTAAINVVLTLWTGKRWTIKNNCTGAFALTVIGPTGTGVVVPAGATVTVYCDGTNIVGGVGISPASQAQAVSGTDGVSPATSLSVAQAAQAAAATYAVDTGASNAYVATLSPAPTALVDGMVIRVQISNGNTGSSTLNLNGLGAKAIQGFAGLALQTGELVSGGRASFMWATGQNSWILLGSQASSLQVSDASQSHHAMTLGQLPAALISNGVIKSIKRQIFTVSGTYTPSTGMVFCDVEVLGGGGGGGGAAGAASNSAAGGGGGAGAYAKKLFTAATIGASQTVTIGAAGTGGAAGANAGVAGGTTTFGAIITCTGGQGGTGASASTPINISGGGNTGGVAAGGDINIQGFSGFAGLSMGGSSGGLSGQGAGSIYGPGGYQAGPNGVGGNASNKGAGGAGAATNSATANAGGAGAPGYIVIIEYCTQ
jgi:hypothetical protein